MHPYRRPETMQLPQPVQTKTAPKAPTFETYYYNAKFQSRREPEDKVEKCMEPLVKTTAEHRRRKLLEDYAPVLTKLREPPAKPSQRPTNSPLLRSCCNSEGYQMIRRTSSVVSSKPLPTQRSPSATTFRRKSSGCQISINISGLSSETELNECVRIKIEPDTCEQNNTDKSKDGRSKSPAARCSSAASFTIDKRLSKFVVPEVPTISGSRPKGDLLLARRLQVQEERKAIERLRQQELEDVRQQARQREESRRHLRELERQRDRERIKKMDEEREKQRLRELVREAQQRRREYERLQRARSMPTAIDEPKVSTSHLQRLTSVDRFPGMAPCYVRQSEPPKRSSRRPPLRSLSQSPKQSQPQPLGRRSSDACTSNASNLSLHSLSMTRLDEPKLLNLHVNGIPVSSSQPIHTRINNMPIRITTSQPTDEHLSVNRVRVPTTRQELGRRRSSSRGSSVGPYSVNINVYADNPLNMRL